MYYVLLWHLRKVRATSISTVWVPLSQGPGAVGDFPRGLSFSFLSMLLSQWASHCHPAVTNVTLLSGDYRVFLPCPLIVGFVARYSSHEALRSLQWDTLWAAPVTNWLLSFPVLGATYQIFVKPKDRILPTPIKWTEQYQKPECLSWMLHGWSDCLRNYQFSYI